MRIASTSVLAAVILHAAWPSYGQGVRSLTLDQRVKAVEQKTGYYKVSRLTNTKRWGHFRALNTRHPQSRDYSAESYFDVPIGGGDPVLTDVWIHVTANYTQDGSFIVANFALKG